MVMGIFFLTAHGVTRKVCTLDRDRCVDFCMGVIKSGILNYSDAVIELKVDLDASHMRGGVQDAAMMEFHISIPELEIEKKFSSYAPWSDMKLYPDIIEFKLASTLEKKILSFVPKDDPFWGPPAK